MSEPERIDNSLDKFWIIYDEDTCVTYDSKNEAINAALAVGKQKRRLCYIMESVGYVAPKNSAEYWEIAK